MSVMQVPITDVILDPRLQMRATLDPEVIDEYAETLDKLPPCKIVMGEGGKMWLTGGWHRYHGHKKAGKDTLPCTVREGTFLDALVEACGENEGHGIRRTPEDKRRAVESLIATPEWAERSDAMIAKACHVGNHLVSDVRSTLRAQGSNNQDDSNGDDSTGSDAGSTDDDTGESSENESSNGQDHQEEKRTGADGKKRPAGKPKPYCTHCQTLIRKGQDPRKNCPMCAELRKTGKKKKPKNPTEPTEHVDAFGTPLPKRCKDAYCDPWIQKAIDFLGVTSAAFWGERLADGLSKRKRHYPHFNVKDFVDGVAMAGNTLDQLLEHLKEKRPAGVCPPCEGAGCPDCKQSGLVPRAEYAKLKKILGAKK